MNAETQDVFDRVLEIIRSVGSGQDKMKECCFGLPSHMGCVNPGEDEVRHFVSLCTTFLVERGVKKEELCRLRKELGEEMVEV